MNQSILGDSVIALLGMIPEGLQIPILSTLIVNFLFGYALCRIKKERREFGTIVYLIMGNGFVCSVFFALIPINLIYSYVAGRAISLQTLTVSQFLHQLPITVAVASVVFLAIAFFGRD